MTKLLTQELGQAGLTDVFAQPCLHNGTTWVDTSASPIHAITHASTPTVYGVHAVVDGTYNSLRWYNTADTVPQTQLPVEFLNVFVPGVVAGVTIPAAPAATAGCNVYGNFIGCELLQTLNFNISFTLVCPKQAKSTLTIANRTCTGSVVNGILKDPLDLTKDYLQLQRNDTLTQSGGRSTHWLVTCPELKLDNARMVLNDSSFDLITLI